MKQSVGSQGPTSLGEAHAAEAVLPELRQAGRTQTYTQEGVSTSNEHAQIQNPSHRTGGQWCTDDAARTQHSWPGVRHWLRYELCPGYRGNPHINGGEFDTQHGQLHLRWHRQEYGHWQRKQPTIASDRFDWHRQWLEPA